MGEVGFGDAMDEFVCDCRLLESSLSVSDQLGRFPLGRVEFHTLSTAKAFTGRVLATGLNSSLVTFLSVSCCIWAAKPGWTSVLRIDRFTYASLTLEDSGRSLSLKETGLWLEFDGIVSELGPALL